MKHTIILLAMLMAAVSAIPASAQKDYKFGKVTKAELLRTDFPDIADGAKMVILDEVVEVHMANGLESTREAYVYRFKRYVEYFGTRKYKIIATDDSRNTKISITFASNEYPDLSRMKARCYTLRNDRIVKRDISLKETEQMTLADGSRRITFTLLNAKSGDIFEYDLVKLIDLSKAETYDMKMQQDIPVLNIKCKLAAPSWHPNNSIVVMDKNTIKESKTSGPVLYMLNPWSNQPNPIGGLSDMKYSKKHKYHSRVTDIFVYEACDIPAITPSEPDEEAIGVRIVLDPKEYEIYEIGDIKVGAD